MTVLGAAAGLTGAVGGLLMLWGLRPATDTPRDDPQGRPPSSAARRAQRARDRFSRRDKTLYGAALTVGVLLALLTGRLTIIIIAPLLVWIAPLVWMRKDDRDVELLKALQEWSLRLASLIGTGHHLIEALTASLRSCPERIRPQVQMLVARMQAGQDTQSALYRFADDLDDAAGDRIADALIHGARQDLTPLRQILTDAAAMVEDEIAGRREILRAQAGPRSESRWISLIFIGTVIALLLYPATGAFYRSPPGALILLALLAGAAACLTWIRRITTPIRPARWLIRPRGVL